MQRIPEPELMDDAEQVRAYAQADFSEPHDRFVALFREYCGEPGEARVLDLGCGPGDICRRFARAFPHCRLHAVDAAPAMLEQGRRDTRAAGLQTQIEFIQAHLPGADLPGAPYAVILSNSLLHHLHDPQTLWDSVRQFGGRGTRVFVMDLRRPSTPAQAAALVGEYAAQEPAVLQRDFYNSLCAAYTPEEVEAQLRAAGLPELQVAAVSDRHLIVWGTSSATQPETGS